MDIKTRLLLERQDSGIFFYNYNTLLQIRNKLQHLSNEQQQVKCVCMSVIYIETSQFYNNLYYSLKSKNKPVF